MNWGGFAAGLAQGFNNGVAMGKTFDALSKERKLDEVRAKGLEEAKGMQESAVADMVKETGIEASKPAAAPAAPAVTETVTPDTRDVPESAKVATVEVNPSQPAGMPQIAAQTGVAPAKRFMVGEQAFATRDEAMAAARKKAPSVMDFMGKTLVPRMQEAYIAQGDMEKAEAWGTWSEQRQSKKAMAEWASAWRAAQTGNIEKAADHVFNLYKTYDDGITPLSKEPVKDKDGNVTGFNVRLKTDATGEERTQFIDQKSLTEMGLAALSPPQMFEMQFKRQQAADQAAASQRAEMAKEGRNDAREIAKEGRGETRDNRKAARDQGYALEKLGIEEQLKQAGATNKVKQEVGAKVQVLRDSSMSDAEINAAIPSLIIGSQFKKGASPEEEARMAHDALMRSDPMFSRKSEADKQAAVEAVMRINRTAAAIGAPKPSPAGVASGGLPAKPKGVPVYDAKTNSIVYR